MKYALLYILIAGLLLGTPGFLSVLQDEYVWGGIFISVVTYFILGLLALLTMKGGVGKSLGVSDKPFGQACILIASTILGSWIHYLLFTRFGGLALWAYCMMQSLWFLIPFLTEFSLSRFHLVPPPIYELWSSPAVTMIDDTGRLKITSRPNLSKSRSNEKQGIKAI